jgi:two-component system cell cycle response regulator DivK
MTGFKPFIMESTKKILIIDDDNRNIFALSAVLRAKKYTCLSSISAQDGFELIEADQHVGVVLMDMMMPDMDGYQAMAKMKENPSLADIPVIAVTAQAMVGDRERCLAAGAVDYISKPVNVDELLLKLKRYL